MDRYGNKTHIKKPYFLEHRDTPLMLNNDPPTPTGQSCERIIPLHYLQYNNTSPFVDRPQGERVPLQPRSDRSLGCPGYSSSQLTEVDGHLLVDACIPLHSEFSMNNEILNRQLQNQVPLRAIDGYRAISSSVMMWGCVVKGFSAYGSLFLHPWFLLSPAKDMNRPQHDVDVEGDGGT